MRRIDNDLGLLTMLGEQPTVSDNIMDVCVKFAMLMYGKPQSRSLTDIRCEKTLNRHAVKTLPPASNSYAQRVLRAAYQLDMEKCSPRSSSTSTCH